ncbi:hypothetical protein CcI49_22440 [Frankia sp. CcI49]|uniref:Uncharacterized protein n=1 Tax=Parafrankia irregularis TaxID=795642 RepID=A0A0S4QTC8_9ACTN|nr:MULTISPECIES: hypothetical protein [Frankiaceae]MBE3201809.1 hypothetical protein [Parafrankia sp. CH37]ONH58247.1 hypothetical protein CcI49_22440 [Frankia sp. CcI49]CUU58290.1 hypothetical protein Ga0074812_11862 [Parafrankia irregularis]
MATEQEYQALYDRVAGLREQLAKQLGTDLIANPQLADALVRQVDDLLAGVVAADAAKPVPPDRGLAALIGVGPEAAQELGQTRIPTGVVPYDESVTSERMIAVGDLYYIYQHERLGVFRVVRKLQELFRAGTVRLSGGPGAYGLYQFDRRDVLRYTRRDRAAAYARVLGYGAAAVPRGSRRNVEFHRQYSHFVNQVALFWRDKRISDVIRERSYDPSFGSIAVVRRAGLDLRNNLKFASFGHLNVLRVEVMQVLDEAFRVLESDDIRRLFGADNAWDVVEEVLIRYFHERLVTSPRQRMAVAGREVLRWLAQPHLLQTSRVQFEMLLLEIAEYAEEWLTSAEALGAAERRSGARVLPFQGRAPLRPMAESGRGATRGVI